MSNATPGSPETLDFLSKRRSHPAVTMTAPGPTDAQLTEILTIAARVPDHGKLVPWRFIVYRSAQGRAIGERLVEIHRLAHGPLDDAQREKELTRFCRAPVVVGVVSCAGTHPKIPEWEQQLSAGAACMNLVTAAAASGFASQWISEWYSFDETASRYLGAAGNERFAGFVHIGTPSQPPVERARPDVAAITSYWTDTK